MSPRKPVILSFACFNSGFAAGFGEKFFLVRRKQAEVFCWAAHAA
jgi:hypothetical protein